MQVSRPNILYLPELFVIELGKYLKTNPPSWNYKIEYFYCLVHHLTVKQIQQKDNEYFSINTKYLMSITIWNIKQYINYLVNGELLLRDNYQKGRKSYHYKINPDFTSDFREYEVKPGTELFTKWISKQKLKRSHSNRLEPYLKEMYKMFMKTELDYDKAKEWIKLQQDSTKQYYYLTALQIMQDKRFRYFKRNKTNQRLDTNLTNLKTELRQFLIGDYVSIDLANSQPFLLSVLLKHIKDDILHINTKDIPLCYGLLGIDIVQWFGKQQFNTLSKIHQNDPFFENGELLKFQVSVVNGRFYDDFRSSLIEDKLTREEVKKIVFEILYSQNVIYEDHKRFVPYAKVKKKFAKVYPSIYRVIYSLKNKDHKKLSVLLQRIESKVFIDMICPDLVEQGIVPLTIHDSIIVKHEQADEALIICKNAFDKYFGLVPAFHVTSLNKN